MDLVPGSASPHKCTIKDKLAELAEEVNSWEDDVRHSSRCGQLMNASRHSPLNKTCRESLAVLDLVPVSAHKARWERLMSKNDRKPISPFVREIRTAPVIVPSKPDVQTSTRIGTSRADIAASGVSQAERERLERIAELAALRQSRRGIVMSSPVASQIQQSVPTDAGLKPKRIESELSDFNLPPPPSPNKPSPETEGLPDKAAFSRNISTHTSANVGTSGSVGAPEMKDTASNESPSLTPNASWSTPEPPPANQGSYASDNFTNISSLVDETAAESCVQPHFYYSRPKFGAKRSHVDNTDESTAVQNPSVILAHQRSVTFAAPHGTAPGDTASEATTLECDAESILRGNSALSCPMTMDSDETDAQCSPNECVSDIEASDSELSELLDNALEEAAAEAVSCGKENTFQFKGVNSDTETTDDDTCAAYSDPEASSNLIAVERDLQTTGLTRKSSFRTDSGQRLIRGSSLRHRTSQRRQRRRQSGSIANALLDGDCPTPTTHCSGSQKREDSVLGTSNQVSEVKRRLDRLDELDGLLQQERNMILQASAAVQQCISRRASSMSASVHPTPKRSRHGDSHRGNPQLIYGLGSTAHVEANRMLLIACQRHQVLMEEQALLRRGSPVLVPPSRGDPIRARLRMSSIRFGLKFSHKPGDPTSGGGGYVVFYNDQLVHKKSTIRLSELRPCPTQYHLLAIIKCRGEGRLYHSEMVTVVPVSDLPVGTTHAVHHVDLPTNIDIVPLRPDFVFTLEVYCMRFGTDGPGTLQLSQSPRPALSTAAHVESRGLIGATPKASRLNLNPSSTRKKARLHAIGGSEQGISLTACLPTSHLLPSFSPVAAELRDLGRAKSAAFTLMSSVEIRYHDDLLLGRLRPTGEDARRNVRSDSHTLDCERLPLRLSRLPQSSPLDGLAGLINASVRLEARILTRGFLTVFEEVGGFGVWQRYWCQLRADHLQFWRYPEDEQRSLHTDPSQSPAANTGPLGRIDLRHVAAPRAVPAPRRICARANTIFMRSLRAIDPDVLSASVNAIGSRQSDQQESLIFRASPDYTWLEQKHLLCADTPQERDRWIMWLNLCLESLKDWMPEHFSCLARFDARLQFSQPVSSKLSVLLVHGDSNE
ncbi:hypothetical protein D915_007052 [Fasciola hepatica]|uniref:PH domain-containing protein n=1 Tax=Fasciola hepatica TaxID=6192 RepID=A0A4E0RVZ8_FASHE|nr:hypothetical protein D915_007052 [Fasciola hepatica]